LTALFGTAEEGPSHERPRAETEQIGKRAALQQEQKRSRLANAPLCNRSKNGADWQTRRHGTGAETEQIGKHAALEQELKRRRLANAPPWNRSRNGADWIMRHFATGAETEQIGKHSLPP
jgi:hypothetical protein